MLKPSHSIRLAGACFVLALLSSSISAQESITATEDTGRIAIGTLPWSPDDLLKRDPRVVYGTHDLVDVYEETDARRLAWAKSVCGMIPTAALTDNGNGTFTISTAAYTSNGFSACVGEPFGNQPTVATCSGFLVGDDLIATAGHCYGSGDFASIRWVFGFEMTNSTTANLVVDEDQVYQGVEVLAQVSTTGADYTILRVDRPVVSTGAKPLPIRRTGTVEVGARVGLMGYPSGLPLKIGFGDETKVYQNSSPEFFVANLDAYGNNSGSPVFNEANGLVEGILVRGELDYYLDGGCFRSNVLPDLRAAEDVTKSTVFAEFIPEAESGIAFGKAYYRCGQMLDVLVRDENTALTQLAVEISTSAGDLETIIVTDGDGDDIYTGSIMIGNDGDSVNQGDGTLQGNSSDILVAIYDDLVGPGGGPITRTTDAVLDCVAPTITNLSSRAYPESYLVSVNADEPVSAYLAHGSTCTSASVNSYSTFADHHSIEVTNLAEGSLYFYRVILTDRAGNITESICPFETTSIYAADVLFENFEGAVSGWTTEQLVGSESWQVATEPFSASGTRSIVLTPSTAGEFDSRLISPEFTDGDLVQFQHTYGIQFNFDGALLEISTDGGSTWQLLESHIVEGEYIWGLERLFNPLIGGVESWTGGNKGPMTQVTVDVRDFPGPKRIGFRFATNSSGISSGWAVDDFRVRTLNDITQPLAAGQWNLYP